MNSFSQLRLEKSDDRSALDRRGKSVPRGTPVLACGNSLTAVAAKCRLCLEEADLKDSHIVPEFVYTPIYNEKHQAFVFQGGRSLEIHQKGLREPLLCGRCETRFSRYEDYAAEKLFRRANRAATQEAFETLSGLNYDKFKLFLLSILWRFGETSLPQLTGVQLGPHRERLRELLDAEDPGDQLQYPCLVTEVHINGRPLDGWIVPPERHRVRSQWVWAMVLGRYLLSFIVSNHSAPDEVRAMSLNQEGQLLISRSDIHEIPYLLQLALAHRNVKM